MDATELRIGNLVNAINNYEDIFIVNSIYGKTVLNISCNEFKNYDTYIKDIKPILLTEKWLLKFGKINWLYKDTHGYYTAFNNKRIYFKFVHSLQNFYFCVEQKELQ
jgi:hypothetical protein